MHTNICTTYTVLKAPITFARQELAEHLVWFPQTVAAAPVASPARQARRHPRTRPEKWR
jgi:hypothetical protein